MADWPRFPRAPITEALLDIRTRLPASVDLRLLATFQEAIKDRYPERHERTALQASIEFKPGEASISSKGGADGFLFRSADGRQIVQTRLDGFTFNRLKPYDQWSTFRDEAKGLWARYVELTDPQAASRVALRYINRIEVPLPMRDFKDYILTVPDIAPKLPQGLAGFLMRLVIPHNTSKAVAIITETMENPEKDVLPLILDIDVFIESPFDPSDESLWEAMESLRDFKNELFFYSLTQKAKELFQ